MANSMHHPASGRFNSHADDLGHGLKELTESVAKHAPVNGHLGAASRQGTAASKAYLEGDFKGTSRYLTNMTQHLKNAIQTYPPARDLAAAAQTRLGQAEKLASAT